MSHPVADVGLFLHAISDSTRRRILQALRENGARGKKKQASLSASDIEQRVKLSQPTISHHMRILENAGLVQVKKDGHWRWYRRNEKTISQMARSLKAQL